MDFRGPDELDFEEVDRRYAHLKQRHEAGNITDQELNEQLQRLMVQDQRGRWWTKARKSGEWHYHDGSAWVKGNPPGVQSKSQETPSTPGPTPEETQSTEEHRQEERVSDYRPPVEQQAWWRRKEVRTVLITLLITVLVLAAVTGISYLVNRASQSTVTPTVESGSQKQQPAKE